MTRLAAPGCTLRPRRERRDVTGEGHGAGGRMHQPDPLLLLMEVGPVRPAGEDRRHIAGAPGRDQRGRGVPVPGIASRTPAASHIPIGTSVSDGWSGWPSQTP